MSVRNYIAQIYKSRTNLLNILESIYGYDISDYGGFSINEIDAMINNDQLDMLLTHKKNEEGEKILTTKTYIKYITKGTTLNSSLINNITDDLFTYSDTLTQTDCLCIVVDSEPNDTIMAYLKYLYETLNIFIVIHNLKRLQFNILEHNLVPKVSIMNEREIDELKTKYVIESFSQLPEISRFDPQALAICLRPGQICKFLRISPTAMTSPYYRICV
uniref:RNA polymerase subunit H/Rpb5 C-terminal domain-containing protein n=1 Tax=viral metagenome TaxID=1070528 RepID=A0A6C0CP84_9ZZZZ